MENGPGPSEAPTAQPLPSSSAEERLKRLLSLERECAELRAGLRMRDHQAVPAMSVGAERAFHSLVAEFAGDVISVHASDGRYLWVSSSCERMFGWRVDEMVGSAAYDLIHPEDRRRVLENHVAHAEAACTPRIDYRLRMPDGQYRWVSSHASNAKDDRGLPQIVVITQDISDRVARLQQLEALLQRESAKGEGAHAGDLTPICAWCKAIRDADGVWLSLEEHLLRATGVEPSHGICPECLTSVRADLDRINQRL